MLQQKLAKRDGARIDRNRDVERLWEFYQLYKRRHSLDDIQKLRESGTSRANLGEYGLLCALLVSLVLSMILLLKYNFIPNLFDRWYYLKYYMHYLWIVPLTLSYLRISP